MIRFFEVWLLGLIKKLLTKNGKAVNQIKNEK
jgi:hypothetical protein